MESMINIKAISDTYINPQSNSNKIIIIIIWKGITFLKSFYISKTHWTT